MYSISIKNQFKIKWFLTLPFIVWKDYYNFSYFSLRPYFRLSIIYPRFYFNNKIKWSKNLNILIRKLVDVFNWKWPLKFATFYTGVYKERLNTLRFTRKLMLKFRINDKKKIIAENYVIFWKILTRFFIHLLTYMSIYAHFNICKNICIYVKCK